MPDNKNKKKSANSNNTETAVDGETVEHFEARTAAAAAEAEKIKMVLLQELMFKSRAGRYRARPAGPGQMRDQPLRQHVADELITVISLLGDPETWDGRSKRVYVLNRLKQLNRLADADDASTDAKVVIQREKAVLEAVLFGTKTKTG